LTVAQVAIAHGLDPFNGEVWGLKGDGKWYGVMVGIKGLRKAARRQAEREGGTYWTEPPARVDPKQYSAKEDAVVYEIRLRDTVTTQAYSKALYSLTTAGIPYAEAIRMMGNAPVWVGIGIATPDERSKLSIHARAKKRAEADAIKQRYDVEFTGAAMDEDGDIGAIDPDLIEGDYTATSTQDAPAESKALPRTEQQLLSGLGF
jgi:hypothetical protein